MESKIYASAQKLVAMWPGDALDCVQCRIIAAKSKRAKSRLRSLYRALVAMEQSGQMWR